MEVLHKIKKCKDCGIWNDGTNFYSLNRLNKNGESMFQSRCIECFAIRCKNSYDQKKSKHSKGKYNKYFEILEESLHMMNIKQFCELYNLNYASFIVIKRRHPIAKHIKYIRHRRTNKELLK